MQQESHERRLQRLHCRTSLPCNSSWSEDEPGTPKLRPLFASGVLLESFDSVKTKSDIAVKITLVHFEFLCYFLPAFRTLHEQISVRCTLTNEEISKAVFPNIFIFSFATENTTFASMRNFLRHFVSFMADARAGKPRTTLLPRE